MSWDEFYIGYNKQAPKGQSKFVKGVIVVVLLSVIIAAGLIAMSQKPFSKGTFELGKLTQLEGVLTFEPIPMLRIDGDDLGVLLIGYGKFGAEAALRNALGSAYKEGQNYKATVEGTLIYSDGKVLLELTKREKSVLSFEEIGDVTDEIETIGSIKLTGEIIDPKCYFGVMKPGEGKPHRSCAIRCISGGIPPVFKVRNSDGTKNYFILRGQMGQPINDMVLDYVAEPVTIQGKVLRFQEWDIIELDEDAGIQPVF